MSLNWMPYPRVGTGVEDGWWFCTVQDKLGGLHVDILDLLGGQWFHRCGKSLEYGVVVAITWVPDPASLDVRKEAKRAVKGKV